MIGMEDRAAWDGIGEDAIACVQAWNLFGGAIAWEGVGLMCDILGFDDPEILVRGLAVIRDAKRA